MRQSADMDVVAVRGLSNGEYICKGKTKMVLDKYLTEMKSPNKRDYQEVPRLNKQNFFLKDRGAKSRTHLNDLQCDSVLSHPAQQEIKSENYASFPCRQLSYNPAAHFQMAMKPETFNHIKHEHQNFNGSLHQISYVNDQDTKVKAEPFESGHQPQHYNYSLQQASFITEPDVELKPESYEIKPEPSQLYNHSLHKANYLEHQDRENSIGAFESNYDHKTYLNNDYIPRLDSLHLESDPSSVYGHTHSVTESDRSEYSDNVDLNDHQPYNNQSFSPYYYHHGVSSSPDDLLTNNYEPNDYQSSLNPNERYACGYETINKAALEEPLDLSIPKEEDSPYSFGDYMHFPVKEEMGEENAWLKKIKTGTRSRVRSPKSWEFLLRLLMDPKSNPAMIKWEDESNGTFRLVQKDEIAKIWGMRSVKHKDGGLSYDNFARNLRYHYKTKMLVPVSEKHLVYKFSNEVMEKRYSFAN